MAINLDQVPDENPSAALEEGTYKATVKSAKMKQPNDASKPMYLEVNYDVVSTTGNTGTFTDRFFESDSSFLLFKLKRFVQALGLNLSGNVELRDIQKLIQPGTQVITIIKQVTDKYNGREQTKNEVDLFDSDCYYPISAWGTFTGEADAPSTTEATESVPQTDNVY